MYIRGPDYSGVLLLCFCCRRNACHGSSITREHSYQDQMCSIKMLEHIDFCVLSGVLITLAPPRLLAIDFSEAPHLIIVYLAGALFHARYYLFTESSLSHPKTDLRNTNRAKPEEANPRSLRRYITNTSAKHSLWDSLDVGLRSSVGQKRF